MAISRPSSRRRTTSSGRPSTRRSWPAARRTSSAWTCPSDEQGDEPGDKYRRAARTLAAWRSDGTFRKDPKPSIYVYEQSYRVPGTDVERTQRGFFARLRLEPLGPNSGVLPHERTLAAPREDRYMLLRATGVNTSPVIGLFDDADRRAPALLDQLTDARPPSTCATTTASAIGCGSSRRPTATPRAPAPSPGS